ncbi:hypothetical protein J6590_032257 [Homalodisca vitripennis]|nr:hypothetical protein J6590_032257 [Homalodisca vitripennis]
MIETQRTIEIYLHRSSPPFLKSLNRQTSDDEDLRSCQTRNGTCQLVYKCSIVCAVYVDETIEERVAVIPRPGGPT